MPRTHFATVQTWVFDLDNTLYPPHMRLFDQIEVKMTDWVMRALQVDRARADHLRAHYWQTYGTTLGGLMREQGDDPGADLAGGRVWAELRHPGPLSAAAQIGYSQPVR